MSVGVAGAEEGLSSLRSVCLVKRRRIWAPNECASSKESWATVFLELLLGVDCDELIMTMKCCGEILVLEERKEKGIAGYHNNDDNNNNNTLMDSIIGCWKCFFYDCNLKHHGIVDCANQDDTLVNRMDRACWHGLSFRSKDSTIRYYSLDESIWSIVLVVILEEPCCLARRCDSLLVSHNYWVDMVTEFAFCFWEGWLRFAFFKSSSQSSSLL